MPALTLPPARLPPYRAPEITDNELDRGPCRFRAAFMLPLFERSLADRALRRRLTPHFWALCRARTNSQSSLVVGPSALPVRGNGRIRCASETTQEHDFGHRLDGAEVVDPAGEPHREASARKRVDLGHQPRLAAIVEAASNAFSVRPSRGLDSNCASRTVSVAGHSPPHASPPPRGGRGISGGCRRDREGESYFVYWLSMIAA